MLMSFKRGQGSIVIRVKILDSSVSTGAGLTGLTFSSTGLVIGTIADNESATTSYTAAGSTIETVTTLGTFSAPTATKCRFREVDSSVHKGVYELQIADARFAVSSAKSLLISISGATNAAQCDAVVPLTDMDPYDAVHGGMSALPNTACTTNASLLTSGTGTDQISVSAGKVLLQATQSGVTIPTVTTVTNQLTAAAIATGVWQDATASDFTTASSIGKSLYTSGNIPGAANGLFIAGTNAATTVNLTSTITGSLSGSVGSVTGAVGSVTGNVGGSVASIAASGISSSSFASGAITTATFAAGAINAAAIADGAIDRATFAADTGLQTVRSGTAQAGAASTITLDASASATDNFYSNCRVYLTGGTGVGQVRTIRSYVGTTKVATINRAWTTNPDNTSTFAVIPTESVWEEITADHVTSGTTGNSLNAAGSAGDPWATAIPGAYGAGTAGHRLGNIPDIAAGSAGGLMIAGSNAATTFATLTVSGATTLTGNVSMAAGLTITQSTLNGHGISVTGNGTGNGILATGGSTSGDGIGANGVGLGNGIHAISGNGATGHGIFSVSVATVGHGIAGTGSGTGDGIRGISGLGATGNGISGVSSATNGNGIYGGGNGSGDGIAATGGATGRGLHALGGATSGAGMRMEAQAGNSNGIEAVRFGSGVAFSAPTTDMVLAKTTNITGFNDIAVTSILSDSTAFAGANIDAAISSRAAAATALSTANWTNIRAGYLDNLSAGAVALASGVVLSSSGLDAVLIESGISASASLTNDAGSQLTSINARQALSVVMSAAAAGVLAGAATTTITTKPAGLPAGNTRVTATVDSSGNRSAMVLKVPT